MNVPARDRAFGRFFHRHGLRAVTKSCATPDPSERLSAWAAQYYRLPAHERNASFLPQHRSGPAVRKEFK
jgi:hypothetical protein